MYFPLQKTSLHNILQSEKGLGLGKQEKITIALKIVKAMLLIHLEMKDKGLPFAHSHLTSKNIFLDYKDEAYHVKIGDYGFTRLKKYCCDNKLY